MRIFFIGAETSNVADQASTLLLRVKKALLSREGIEEVHQPHLADTLLIQEKGGFKDFRYINQLCTDPLIRSFAHKLYTINCDDCATGLLRGVYTSLPKSRFNIQLHAAVPYMEYPNELVFQAQGKNNTTQYLASWRGNAKSNHIRRKMIELYNYDERFLIQTTESWLNHDSQEKERYVSVILSGKFSLCPAGWAPVSFRIYESMALSRCPVIIADDFVPPAGPVWKNFSIHVPQSKLHELPKVLQLKEYMAKELGEYAKSAWDSFFHPANIDHYYADTLLTLIENAPLTSTAREIKRWNSIRSYWNNHWTIPQRFFNRIKKWKKATNPM